MTLAAVAQFCASSAIEANTTICCQLVKKAAQQGAKLIFLPEASDFISETKEQAVTMTESLEKSSFVNRLQQIAQEEHIWISAGIHEKCTTETSHIYNTHILINGEGQVAGTYQKVHLFDVDIKNGPRLMESDSTKAGTKVASPISTPFGVSLGLQTCYDIRFAELSIQQRRQGAHLLAFPSAFTVKTGMAHWETLVRARAIETQCYVVASAQQGQHNTKRTSYGNAMIVDPWGTVLARCPDSSYPSLAFATIDLDYLNKIRTEMPVMAHRRYDLYPTL